MAALKGKKSNTYRLTQAFVEGISESELKNNGSAPNIEVLEISKMNIKSCLGCFACWNKTPGKCCIRDDMASVLEKLLWADLIIWSFPLYYFSVPGQLKNMIDRQLPMALPFMEADAESGGHAARFDMSKKRTVLISTCGFYTPKGNYDGVTSMFDHFCGKDSYTAIFCGQGELFRVKELSGRTDEYLSFVKTAGSEYVSGNISDATWQKLNKDLYPRDVFEKMADSSWGVSKDGEKVDESLTFTRQMSALYNKNAWSGKDVILEMNYTDIGKTYQIVLGKDGSSVCEELSNDFTTRINTPLSVWRSIASGEIKGSEALMKHLYSVEGDFNVMLHWDKYFGRDEAPSNTTVENKPKAKTNMNMLLIPWIAFWVAASIDVFWGSLISIGICVLIPLVMYKTKATIYDKLSCVGVVACSIALLVEVSSILIIPLSYLLFGIMWTVSCFTKIPLTAHYSQNDYNGEAALQNPIFMKTNRILTAVWGILYLLTPIWTYFILQTDLDLYIGIINSVIPAGLGVFTAWFQRWYPERIAKGMKF